ncbi:NAD/NADP octopine/nopaline dehydrogenase family protein [Sporosarcina jeotgali]|uniref:NAD/NADP octopine/nopaline dehydrogenase family protein n=1 Tax=Sporosarcina jeotgali TaxID=3020056 RepID=A0ABZ0KXH1_9BACL|nr:NAD/NADP octopine/nopaline dehydrogenase family protein [Sporosarcina sp. B2O-1]WOV84886.1 NAD/NADP octopine/nopaline dehydrogenase family protein [Sporosarcina sp. B2O-1]
MSKMLKWTIIGGGNGGQTTAGHLGMMGFDVTIYDIFEDTINAIKEQGGVHLQDALTGFGKVACATTSMEEALKDADIVFVTVPATAHASVAKSCAPYLKDGQIVILNPAASFGSLVFRKTLDDEGCKADVTLGETNTLLYGCRIIQPGTTQVFGLKNRILTAALPATETARVVETLQTAFPQFEACESILVTSFDNTNPILHPATTLFNTGIIESEQDWRFYVDGFTPSIGRYVEKMDAERMAIGKVFGLELLSCMQQMEVEYDVFKDTLSESVSSNPVYQDIGGQNTLETRYLTEDIPMGLVPFIELGKMVNLPTIHMETAATMGQLLLGRSLMEGARTLENLGVKGMSVDEFLEFVQTGRK